MNQHNDSRFGGYQGGDEQPRRGTGMPSGLPSGLPMGVMVAVVAAVISPGIWVGLFWLGLQTNNGLPPVPWWAIIPSAPLMGLFIGLLAGKCNTTQFNRLPIICVLLTLIACVVGHVIVDQYLITWQYQGQTVQPTLGDSLNRLFNDFMKIVLIALGCYIAYITSSSGSGKPQMDANERE